MPTHRDLWPGIQLKLDNANFHLERMAHALREPEAAPRNLALMSSSGANFDHTRNWHREFYAHLDAFLSTARSLPEIIRCCFGADESNRTMRNWFGNLDAAERRRRRTFDAQYKPSYDSFRALPLGIARHISEHRTGFAPVTVKVSGRFGVTYTGDPITRLPVSEMPSIEGEWLGSGGWMPQSRPLRPSWGNFTINDAPLFDTCRSYVAQGQTMIERAEALAEQVHAEHTVTSPPDEM